MIKSLKRDYIELVYMLMEATTAYTASHIDAEKHRFAYVRAMSRCMNLCKSAPNRGSTESMVKALLKLRKDSARSFSPKWFDKASRYYMLGIEQAIDVVQSIHVRFEKEHAHSDEWFVKTILGDKNEI